MKFEEEDKIPPPAESQSGGDEANSGETAASRAETSGLLSPDVSGTSDSDIPQQASVAIPDDGSASPPAPPPEDSSPKGKKKKKGPVGCLFQILFRLIFLVALAGIGTAIVWYGFKEDLIFVWQKYNRQEAIQVRAENAKAEALWKRDEWRRLADSVAVKESAIIKQGDRHILLGDEKYAIAQDLEALSNYVTAFELFLTAHEKLLEDLKEAEWLSARANAAEKKKILIDLVAQARMIADFDAAWAEHLLAFGQQLDNWNNDSRIGKPPERQTGSPDSDSLFNETNDSLIINDSFGNSEEFILAGNDAAVIVDREAVVYLEIEPDDSAPPAAVGNAYFMPLPDFDAGIIRRGLNDSLAAELFNDAALLTIPADETMAIPAFGKAQRLYEAAIIKIERQLYKVVLTAKNSADSNLKSLFAARDGILAEQANIHLEIDGIQLEMSGIDDQDELTRFQKRLDDKRIELRYYYDFLDFFDQEILNGRRVVAARENIANGDKKFSDKKYGEAKKLYQQAYIDIDKSHVVLLDSKIFWREAAWFNYHMDDLLLEEGMDVLELFSSLNYNYNLAVNYLKRENAVLAHQTINKVLETFRYYDSALHAWHVIDALRDVTQDFTDEEYGRIQTGRMYYDEGVQAFNSLQGLKAKNDFELTVKLIESILDIQQKRIDQENAKQAEIAAQKELEQLARIAEDKARRKRQKDEILSRERGLWVDPATGMEFVWLQGGCFQMGSLPTESRREFDEEPLHQACVDSFWLGKYEVTQEQWLKIMGKNNSEFVQGGTYPVDKISWNDARKFAQKLAENDSNFYTFRLPTEAEWEYASRAGGNAMYSFGNRITDSQANYNASVAYEFGEKGVYRKKTTPVGSFPPNGFGLYDMHGNVYEWCEDWYDPNFYRSTSATKTNPVNLNNVTGKKVLRGGSWFCYPWFLRNANRFSYKPMIHLSNFGMRLVRELPVN